MHDENESLKGNSSWAGWWGGGGMKDCFPDQSFVGQIQVVCVIPWEMPFTCCSVSFSKSSWERNCCNIPEGKLRVRLYVLSSFWTLGLIHIQLHNGRPTRQCMTLNCEWQTGECFAGHNKDTSVLCAFMWNCESCNFLFQHEESLKRKYIYWC